MVARIIVLWSHTLLDSPLTLPPAQGWMVPKVVKFISLMIAGRWVTMHQQAKAIIKKRRILLPPFGPSESRAQIPVFRECAGG